MIWLGDRVQHRAWPEKTGTVTDAPFEESHLGYIDVQWDSGREETIWIPSIKAIEGSVPT